MKLGRFTVVINRTALRVLDALVLREINARYAISRLGYLWAIVVPLLSIMILYLVFSLIRQRETGDVPLLMFLVTGWFTYGFYQSMSSTVASGEAASRSLLMHQNVTRLDVMSARACLDTLTTVTLFGFAAVLAGLIEGSGPPAGLMLVTVSLFGAGLLGLGVGITMGAIMTYFPMAMNFLSPVNRIGFFTSGVVFTAAMLPSWTYEYLKWNPMIHPVEGVRQGWFDSYQSPILDLGYTYSIALPLIALGLYLERRTRRGIKFG
jgi:capsular polysaccharide transport system permease protein